MNIAVNRKSVFASHKAFIRASNDLESGISISIFPEGTIPESAPDLGRLKNGAFKLAIEKQIDIVPIVYLDNWHLVPDKKGSIYFGKPGIARVCILDPISTKHMTLQDQGKLRNEVQQKMQDVINKYLPLEERKKLFTYSKH